MALHLIKLCVGADEIADLARYVKNRTRGVVHTRQTPKRAEELIAGGSLYWVIKGQILARQIVVGVETIGENGLTRCEIELDNRIILTTPQPRRAFQGWRYLTEGDAPPDLETEGEGAVPSELAAQLRSLGVW